MWLDTILLRMLFRELDLRAVICLHQRFSPLYTLGQVLRAYHLGENYISVWKLSEGLCLTMLGTYLLNNIENCYFVTFVRI